MATPDTFHGVDGKAATFRFSASVRTLRAGGLNFDTGSAGKVNMDIRKGFQKTTSVGRRARVDPLAGGDEVETFLLFLIYEDEEEELPFGCTTLEVDG